METQRRTTWLTGFLAILYYEFLWNLRKKKIIGLFTLAFVIVTLSLALTPILDYINGVTLTPDPNTVTNFFNISRFLSIFIFLIAVAATMNTISGEFETGSITPLLTKPISKNTVFIGKIVAAVLTLLAIYAFLTVYVILGALVIEGPQNDLQLAPLGLLGLTLATMVWASIVIFLGTLSKNSLVAALGSFGIFIALTIVGSILGSFYGQTAVLFYTPGGGATGTRLSCNGGTPSEVLSNGFATGTDNLCYLLIQFLKTPNDVLNFCGVGLRTGMMRSLVLLSSDTVAAATLRVLGVALAYTVALLLLSWYAFRRAQIVEST